MSDHVESAGVSSDGAGSKDHFFTSLAKLVDQMIAAHGKDFTMGTLVLAARFIAEGKTLEQRPGQDAPS